MDITQLRSLVTIDASGKLTVELDDLAAASITADFKPYFDDGKISLTGARQTADDGTRITVTGTGAVRPMLNATVTATFWIRADATDISDNVGVSLDITGTAEWRFDSLFQVLEQSSISYVAFQSVSLTLGSHDDQTIGARAGMFIDAPVDMPATFSVLSFVLGSTGHVTGQINMMSGVPEFVLPAGPLTDRTVAGIPLGAVEWKLYSDPSFNWDSAEWDVDTYTGVDATLEFDKANDGKIVLGANISAPDDPIMLYADFDEGLHAALRDVQSLLGRMAGDSNAKLDVPVDNLKIGDAVTFDRLMFNVATTPSPRLQYIIGGITTDLELHLVGDLLILQALQFAFRVDFPEGGTTKYSTVLSGLIGIGKSGTLQLSASYDTQNRSPVFAGGLREGDPPLNITEVFSDFLGLTDEALQQAGVPSLEVTTFDFSFEPKVKSYRGEIELTGDWPLPFMKAVVLEDVGFDIRQADEASGVRFKAATVLRITDVRFELDANYDGPDAGWSFSGKTLPESEIPVGEMISDLAQKVGIDGTVPDLLADMVMKDLEGSLNTKTKDYALKGEIDFPVAGKDVALTLGVEMKHSGATDYTRTFTGDVKVAGMQFDVLFEQEKTASSFVASYQDVTGHPINFGDVLGAVTTDQGLIDLGKNIDITVQDAVFVYDRTTSGQTPVNDFIFGLDIGAGIDLSKLPLVGSLIPKDQSLRLTMAPIVASKDFDADAIKKIQAKIPDGGTQLPKDGVSKGPAFTITMQIGTEAIDMGLPLQVDQTTGTPAEDKTKASAAQASGDDGVKWIKIQKSLGPVHFERVGVKYADSELSFLLDGSFSAAGLTVALLGLKASSPIDDFKPTFGLDGLGIDYSNAAVEIGAAFARNPPSGARTYTSYDGMATIKAEAFSLSAIGSYANLDGHPSMFIYGVLGAPLGGPAFFFVTGLAFGFGYNRGLVIPPIEGVKTFPLVAEALDQSESDDGASGVGGDPGAKILQVIGKLGDAVPAEIGQYFLAAGIKFTSFELIDSFALLTISFGNHFELDVLGLSTAIIPTPEAGKAVPPVAEVQMAFKAVFDPEAGYLSVQAQLTPASFLLSRDCHLTGGFAFVVWINDNTGTAGDFVLTLGGYHPRYDVPAQYPDVPRLGFDWRISDKMSIKGDAYFALTPNAVMAGGHLDATWKDGALEAWIRAGVDFIIAWKPYYYDAEIYVDIGVKYTYHLFGTHHISVELGADLHIWGPDFSGTATVHLWIVSFTVEFGAGDKGDPPLLDWDGFKGSFLPADAKICTISVADGLTRTVAAEDTPNGKEVWIIDPKHFSLALSSVIPLTEVAFGTADHAVTSLTRKQDNTAFERFVSDDDGTTFAEQTQAGDEQVTRAGLGIGTMGLKASADAVTSKLTVTFTGTGDTEIYDFGFEPIVKNVPAAMWGDDPKPDINAKALVEHSLAGFTMTPKVSETPGHSSGVERKRLQYHVDGVDDAYSFAAARTLATDQGAARDVLQQTMTATDVAAARTSVIGAFGVANPELATTVTDTVAASLLADPALAA